MSACLVLAALPLHATEAPVQKKIMLASSIGPIDAGIVGALEEAFTKMTGIAVEHVGAGTGRAIQMGCADDHPGLREGQVRRASLLPNLTGRKETLTPSH